MFVRPAIASLFEQIIKEKVDSTEEMVEVLPATQRVAFAYERFRNTLEPDEQDILRRRAIHRILERRLEETTPPQATAEALLQELIRAHYIEPVTKRFAAEVAHLLYRAQLIRNGLAEEQDAWFLQLVAVTLDRKLYPRQREEALVRLMYQDTFPRIAWADDLVEESQQAIQLYIACHRALFEADNFEIAYHYFVHHFPKWLAGDISTEEAASITRELPALHAKVLEYVNHPARDRLARFLLPVAVPYRIVRMISKRPEALNSADLLEQTTRKAVTALHRKLRGRMNRRAWHSILFLFFTKTVVAGVIEIPYEVFLLRQFHLLALTVNIGFHPILLFFLATTVRLPGASNTNKIVEFVHKIVTNDSPLPTVVIRRSHRYGRITWTFFGIIYAILLLTIFWAMFSILEQFDFSLVAMFIFVMFLGLVTFLAIRIRRSLNRIRVLSGSESTITTLIGFLSLPILEFGRWLAKKVRDWNIFLIIMDRVLEAPFKFLIDVLEEWFIFVRERRDEIQ